MTLGITTIQRNRAPWIKEWVAFHYLVGFRKFYFIAHKCTDNTERVLNDLKRQFDIKVFLVSRDNAQLEYYNKVYSNFGHEVDWMAFIDGDEFLFPTFTSSMEEVFKEFSDQEISALGAYWSCFGSSGYIEEPEGLIIENYRYRAENSYPNNRHIKSIVVGKQGESITASDPHLFNTPLGTYDEKLRLVTNGWTDYEPSYEKFRINHYVCQSRSYFLTVKSQIPTPDGSSPRSESYWQEHDKNEILDDSMDRFLEPLKNILVSI